MKKQDENPTLWSVPGILPFLGIGFLNAFNDIGLKTLLYDAVQKALPPGPELVFFQSLLQMLVLIPFVAFFTPAGFFSDKWAKDKVIRVSTFAAIPLALGLVYAFHAGLWSLACWLLLALATQAALYSPSKYGFVKEMVGSRHLASANAAIQGLTIVAILLSTFLFSVGFEHLYVPGTRDLGQILSQNASLSWVILAGFCVEWLLALKVPRIGVTDLSLKFSWGGYLTGKYLRSNLADAWNNVSIRN